MRQFLPAGHDRDDQVLGGVQRGQRTRQRPDGGAYGLRFAAERDVVEGAQGDRHRQVVQGAVDRDEPLHRARRQRLQLIDRARLRGDQRGGQRLGTETDAHLGEVLVARPPFPHPAALGDERPQLLGGGVKIVLGVTLCPRRLLGDPTGL